jgi:DNA-binding response OmpR family regulator
MQQVLIVEDDRDIGCLLARHAGECGARASLEDDGLRGLQTAQRRAWDLIILDWRLPGLDGLSVCRRLRAAKHSYPILMLTARAAEADRIAGLDAGADDFVAKPFSVAELKARMRSQLRRAAILRGLAAPPAPSQTQTRATGDAVPVAARLVEGAFTLDPMARRAMRHDRELDLTTREYELLQFLLRHPRQVYSRQQLLGAVWGAGYEGFDHTVNSHINRLRAKIEDDPAIPAHLVTLWGVGYRFEPGRAS